MYQFIPRRSGTVRFFIACLIAFTLFTTPLASLAAARKQVAFKAAPSPSAPAKSSDSTEVKSSVSNVSAMNALLVPTITASKVDALFTDVNADTNVDPGDTLEYTVTIQNTGTDATGVTFTDTIDAHTTLVGAVNTSPIAFDDPSYNATGNVQITISAPGVLANDIDPDTGTNAGLTASAGATSANGGNVTMNANGSFTYDPAPGFTGTDTFTYTVTDGTGATGTGTVTFTVTGMIWFVNSALGVNGNGRLSAPFNCLVGAGCYSSSANDPGDNIFLYSSATAYNGGLVLKNNQRLIGGGASASLSTITGLTPPAGSLSLPSTGGANPTVTTAVAATDSITLAQGNTLRGFNITNSTDSDIAGNNFGTASITEMTLSGTGRALDLINGTLSSSALVSVTVDSSLTQGIFLQQVAGSLTIGSTTVTSSTTQGIHVAQSTADVSFGTTSVGNATAAADPTIGVSLQSNTAGTRTFGVLTIQNTSAQGLLHGISTAGGGGTTTVTGATTITNPGGNGIDIQDSTTTINFQAAANITQSGGTGVFIDDSTGAVSFTDLDINPDAGQRGLWITDHATGTITTTSGTITTTTGTAVEITGASTTPLAMVLTQVTVNGAPSGIVIQNNSGTFSVIGDNTNARNGSGGSFTNTTSDGVRLSNGNNITLKSININSPGDTVDPDIADNESTVGEHGVEAIAGSNIILSGILIDGPSASGMVARDLTGTSRINNNSLITNIDNASTHGLYIRNDTGNLTLFEVNDTDFTNSSSGAATINFKNSGSSNMTVEIRNGCIFEALSSQAITGDAGALAGTTGTVTSLITGNTFRNAVASEPTPGVFVTSENNVAALVANSATHNATISSNLFENIAEDGRVANTSIIRTQNAGGKLTAIVENNTIQNIGYLAGAGGRHVIGHVFEPISYSAANFSNLRFSGNFATNITYSSTNREFIFIDYREFAAGGDIRIQNNNWNMPTAAATSEQMDLNFNQVNASTVDLLVDNNGQGSGAIGNTSSRFLKIDSEELSNLNATVTNNKFTNNNGSPGLAIDFETVDPIANATASPTMCVNVSGNNLAAAGNSIRLNEVVGTMNVTQASAAAITAANGGAAVTVVGTPTFSQPTCALPTLVYVPRSERMNDAVASVSAQKDLSSVVATVTAAELTQPAVTAPLQSEVNVTTAIRRHSHHAISKIKRAYQAVTNLVTAPAPMMLSGETVTVNGSGAGFTLPAGKTITIKFRVTVDNPPNLTLLNPARVSNQGTVEGTNFTDVLTDDPAVGGAADPTETLIDLFDSQTTVGTSGSPSVQGTSVTFTATVTPVSSGPTPVTGTVDFFDGAAIPANLIAGCDDRPLSGNPAQATCTTTALTAAGSPHTITARYNADGGNYDASSGTVSQTVILVPDLTINKQHTGTFFQGQTGATYTITVTNSGNGAMPTGQSISVTDTLPDGLTATAMTGTGWTCTPAAPPNTFPVSGPATINCVRSGDTLLAAAASYPNITLTVNVDSDAPTGNPALSNDVSVTQGAGGEVNTGNNTDTDPTAINAGVDLTIDKSHTDIFTQGDTGKTYTITVTNSGGTASSGTVTVADTLPTGLTPTAPNGAHNGWTCGIVGQDLTCTRSDVLNPAASYPAITLTVSVANNAPASVDNTATVSGGGDINGTNNSDTDTTTINQLCLTPPANMVAWWTGDNTARDIAGGNDGTLNGNAGYAAGKVLNGFNLDGTGDFVQAPDSNSLDLTTAITIDAWVNPTNVNPNGNLVDKISVGGTDGYSLDLVNGNLRFKFGSQSAQSTAVVANGTFTHVAVTYDGANVAFYINGVLDSATPLTGAIPVNALPLRIGAAQDGSSGFAGVIDEVEIFSTALPVADILAISNAGTQGKCKPSDLRITKTHSGNFYLNQTGATYTITVTNDGPGDTTGTVTVTDTLPAGLTATGFSGTNWTCQPLPALSCSRSDVLASGGVYENITLTVNVDSGAPTGPNAVTNTATVSGGGGLDTSDDTANDPTQINTLPDNMAPVNTVPGPQVTNEDVAIVFTGATQISIADADAGSNPVQVSLTATNGVISLSGTTGLNFACGGCGGDGTSDPSMVFQGTITDINNALNNLTFTPTLNYSGPASLQIVTDDLGNTGFGGSQSDTDTINITVNSVNDPPSFTIAGDPPTVGEDAGAQTVNGFATAISPGPGEAGQVLTFNVSPTGTTGTLTFSTAPAIDSTTGNLTYTATNGTSGTASFSVTLSDNGSNTPPNSNTSGAQTFTITVVPNAAPVVTTTAGNLAYTENDPATAIDPGLTVTDSDNTDLTGATVSITAGFVSAQDTLAFTDQLGITGNYNSGTGVLTLTGTTTVANYQTALRTVTYQNSSDAPTSSRTITFSATDGLKTGSATRGIDITAVNDGPVNTVPVAQSTNEDTPKVFSGGNGNQISVADADVGANPIKITLTATNGTVTLSGTTGLTFTPPADGTDDATMVFTGLLADVNNALNGLSFTPTLDFSGAASLQIISDDQGSSGTGGAKTDTDTVNITVNAVGDSPVVTATAGNLSYTENDPATAIDPGLTVTDVDSANLTGATVAITSNFASAEDVLAFTDQLGITGNYNSGTGVLTLTGTTTVANYQTALRSVTYQNSSQNPSTLVRTVTFTADDGTATGSATRGIAVTSVNDAPVNTVPPAQQILVDAPLTFSSGNSNQISVDDVDAGGSNIQVALSVTDGALTLSGTSGLSFSFTDANGTGTGDGTSDAAMTFRGTLADINSALNGMTFTPSLGFSGVVQLQIITNDLGNTGSGGAKTDTDTVDISVVATLALTVNTTGDQADANVGDRICDVDLGTGGDQCTLRAAIQETNAAATADTIGFSLPASSTIELTSALPAIAGDLEINGPTNKLTIDGNNTGRVFEVTSGTVSIDPLTITGGLVNGGHGAGLLVTGGDVTLKDLLFTANTAINGNGGAIAVTGGLLTILNTTISGNTATNAGGVYLGGGALTMINVTVTNNTANGDTGSGPTATGDGGGLAVGVNPSFVRNSIIAGNTATTNTNISGSIGLGGNNLVAGDPRLAPLADNGGPTMTHALLAGSPAIDAGDNNQATTAGLVNDQRGFDRITDGNGDTIDTVDIGAFEAQVFLENIADRAINEDGSDSFSFNVGGAAPITNVTATSSNTALVPNAALLISGAGGSRTLQITPAPNAFGTTTITVTVESASGNMTDTFEFTVNPVNDPPSFTGGPNQLVGEDAGPQSVPGWATAISPGPANEAGQVLTFQVTNDNNALFSAQPSVAADGTLTYTPAANATGVANVTVTLLDNGGGTNASAPYLFTITVSAVNDPPTFTGGPNQTVNEDAGPQSVPNWATGISPGPADESGQTLTFLVNNNNNSLFSAQPAIAVNGTLTFTPAANASGVATVFVQLQDNGGGTDSFPVPPYQFTITVNAVNDAPSFTKGPDQTVNEDSGAQSVPNWATAISAGPANESGQTVAFNVTNDNNALFSVQPAVSPTGTLTYTPAPNANGSATVSVSVTDSGGTANGGQNTSAVQTFTITVNAVNDGPVNTVPGAQSVTENGTLTFSAGNGNQISIADVDAGAPGVQVTLSATNGTITLAGTAGLAFSVGDGTADPTMTFTGTVASINTALNGLVFTPTSGFNGAASLQIVTNDLGNTGSGGALSDTDTVNITVNDGGALQFDSATYSVNESAGTATITVTRTGGTAGTATVDFTTSNGTATAGVSDDYLTSSGTLTFGPGVTSQSFTVTINNDPNNESNETVNLTLSNVTGSGSLGSPSTAVLTIVDNDPGGALQFSSATYTVGESAGTILITVERVGGSSGTAFVDFAASNGTATVGEDYGPTSGTLTFGNGVTSQTFSVPILNNAANEPSETVNLTLSNVLGTGQLGIPSTAVLTITDDDIGFGLSASSYTVGEGSVNLAITVNRLGDTTLPATVEYSTSDLSAGLRCEQFNGVGSERCDYSARIGVLAFAAGQSSATINIPIVDDVHVEGPETFNITLSNPIGAVLGTPLTAVITITDNDTVFTQANPIDTFPFYVRMQYLDFLEREPDAVGFAYWLDRLNTCAANPQCNLVQERIQVSAGFFYSNEFLLRKGYFIYRFYRASLGRAPTYHEFVKDMAAIGAVDADENARRAAFTLNWVTRPDFMAIYNGLSDADFVDQLVNTAGVNLNRPQLVAELQGGKSRAQLVRDVAENVLVYDKYFREAFVTTQYFGYLKRDPDAIGFAYWMDRVNLHPNDFRLEQHPEIVYEVVGGFIYSEEYQLRFGNRNY